MPDIQKISVALTGEQVEALRAAVNSGAYATTSEVVREAIRDWQLKHALRRDEIELLRQLWDEGEASGSPVPLDFDEVRKEARRLLELEKKAERGR
ncbi:MAG TPA: type II toxin-antitoxin system ParD family antitoxin [Stellaceae bacterium]|jgi:antitoxin ParD1/3/4|nr:type II toxin-antitoxin system ParD family antitoxin [Stellaceae bacterium]